MTTLERIDQNKTAIASVRPFEGNTLKQLRDYYRVGLTWSSNALEGNTLTLSETKVVLEDGITIGGRPLRDFYETVGHGEAYDFMFSLIGSREITLDHIRRLHQLFYRSIDESNAGVWRKESVMVSGSEYVFPKAETLDSKMEELAGWIVNERDNYHPVNFAAMLHLKFVSIHPFIDGNGRTARLLMNLALLQDGYMLAIVPPVLRVDYNLAIGKYQNQGDPQPFLDLIAEQELETQKEIIRLLHIPTATYDKK